MKTFKSRPIRTKSLLHWLVAALALFAAPMAPSATKDLAADGAPPQRDAVRIGDTLYLSAQGSRDPVTGDHPGDLQAATNVVMQKLKRQLEMAEFDFSDVVAAQVWLTDLGHYSAMNEAYGSFFGERFPTRTTLGVAALPDGSPVQISMVAVKGPKKVIHPPGDAKAGLPFSPGVLAGDTLYLSGHVGIDPQTGKLIDGDTSAHVLQTLENIHQVLKAAEMDFSNVVSAYLYMTDADQFGAASAAYLTKITQDPKPARLPMSVAALPLGSPVEITMIASRSSRRAVIGAGQPPSSSYSRGLLSGGTLHLAGIFRRNGELREQVDSAVEWMSAILSAGELSLSDVVDVRIYLAAETDAGAVASAYETHFPEQPPALSVVVVPRLPAKSQIMMGVVAARRTDK